MGCLKLTYYAETEPKINTLSEELTLKISVQTLRSSYLFGFNGKENDNEVKGSGVQYDYGMRIYDARLGKFLSVDPLTESYPMLTPYQFASNRPIDGIDIDGLEYCTYLFMFFEGQSEPEIRVFYYNPKQHNEYGSKGRGVDYVYKYFDKKGNVYTKSIFLARNAKKFGIFPTEYGLYYGATSLFKVNGKYDYRPEPVDACDYAAREHDKNYDAVNAVGEEGFRNDWGTIEADFALIESWQQIVNIGIGGQDPYKKNQVITEDEYDASWGGIYVFKPNANRKKMDAAQWYFQKTCPNNGILRTYGEFEMWYDKFREAYMQKNSEGRWERKPDMWVEQKNGTYAPIIPTTKK